jgi:hypothetical protein
MECFAVTRNMHASKMPQVNIVLSNYFPLPIVNECRISRWVRCILSANY